jgi:7-carboxy-7-deazaguanine synthase
MNNIPISEMFLSLQGEWRSTWIPVIFVRFWGCNLKCKWCDSKYAWDKKYIKEMQMMSLLDITKEIRLLNCNHIVFTWWEPALFEKHIEAIQEELW